MKFEWVVFVSILIINTVAALVLAVLVARKRYAPGSKSIASTFITLAIWTFAYAMITISPTLGAKVFWLKVENIGIVSTPVFWFFFALQYTRRDKWMAKPWVFFYWIIPLVTLFLLFSGRWFNVYYTGFSPVDGLRSPLLVDKGFWYKPQMIQSYALFVLGFAILLWDMFRLREIYRRQIGFVLAALLAPLLVNVFYQIGSKLVPGFSIKVDLTPISFTITAFLVGVGVFSLRMFDLIPIARNVVMENIPEMVLVVDSYNRILDINTTALKWLNKSVQETIGNDLLQVFSLWAGVAGKFQYVEEVREEIQVPGNPPRTLELIISPLYNNFGSLEGRVILARDVTDRKNAETALKNANVSLRAQVAEIESLRIKLQEQAIRDPLTGVFNRRYLAESLDGEIARAEREGLSVSVVILDIDHFKIFNDTYGHKCGDLVLQCLGSFLLENTRRSDIVCRYGGEEFTILMPDADPVEAFERAEDWRSRFEAIEIEYNGERVHATFSAGVASLPAHGIGGEAILQKADQALYKAKANGRNQVSLYGRQVEIPVEPEI